MLDYGYKIGVFDTKYQSDGEWADLAGAHRSRGQRALSAMTDVQGGAWIAADGYVIEPNDRAGVAVK